MDAARIHGVRDAAIVEYLMSDPTALRADARAVSATAVRCELLADDIERRRLLIDQRIEPVRTYHVAEVWDSRAADVSREVLSRYIAAGLWFLGADLAITVRRLRDEVGELEARASQLTETAFVLDAALRREAITGRSSIEAGALYPPIGPSLPPPDVR